MLTATDNVTELDISELVDMESEPGCEHSGHPLGRWGHGGPAWAVIRFHPGCPCKPSKTFLICEQGYQYGLVHGLRCYQCGAKQSAREGWTLVQVL